MYRTVEELKTVNNTVAGSGLSATTVRVITDQKYWLNKSEPEDDYHTLKEIPEEWEPQDSKHQAIIDNPLLASEDALYAEFNNPLYMPESDAPVIYSTHVDLSTGVSKAPTLQRKGSTMRRSKNRRSEFSERVTGKEEASFVHDYNRDLNEYTRKQQDDL